MFQRLVLRNIIQRRAFRSSSQLFVLSRPAQMSCQSRWCSSDLNEDVRETITLANVNQQMQIFNDKYAEAKLLIDDAAESAGTRYFEEDLEDAKVGVEDCVRLYTKIIADLEKGSEEERAKVSSLIKENEMKVKQLKESYEVQVPR